MLVQCPSVAPDQHFRMFSSSYKDSNTLHLPTERFSPVRRFSDGAASIQAFKAHLEKMGNNSSIKQLQQVMRGHHTPPKLPRAGVETSRVWALLASCASRICATTTEQAPIGPASVCTLLLSKSLSSAS